MSHDRDEAFVRFVLDQLQTLGEVRPRPMFGGHGLYHRGVFFGIVFDGRLYLKTDADTVADYVAAGMGPFRPTPRQTLARYYEVPAEIIEDAELLAAWARTAVAVAGSDS